MHVKDVVTSDVTKVQKYRNESKEVPFTHVSYV